MNQTQYQQIVNAWQTLYDSAMASLKGSPASFLPVMPLLEMLVASEATDAQKANAMTIRNVAQSTITVTDPASFSMIWVQLSPFIAKGLQDAQALLPTLPKAMTASVTSKAASYTKAARFRFPVTAPTTQYIDEIPPPSGVPEGLPGWVMPVAVLGAVAVIGGVYWYMTREPGTSNV